MTALGLVVSFLGFVVAFMSLALTQSVNGRMAMVLAGIAISLVGIMGLITPAYQKTWIWRR